MTEFKSISYCVDGEDGDEILYNFVVPDHVTSVQVLAAMMDDSGDMFEFICECAEEKDAILIAQLLTRHYQMH